ncbi:concanavalin A-like lectin/glucanase domain-containing protein [Cladorrhinum sp. PSN259]|nr:concanavalin A-like lectin/glucanase domain-containing protein [Cladorrhinum sp. PSN259]
MGKGEFHPEPYLMQHSPDLKYRYHLIYTEDSPLSPWPLSEYVAGLSKYSGNKAGAKYGTGYCDAQCPRDLKFINGEANNAGGSTYSDSRYAGTCDPDGCDFNSYRQGDRSFYGPGMTVDTTKKFTVVTQFIKGFNGQLSEIKRFYVQNGKMVAFNDNDIFEEKGGMAQFSKAIEKPMVLVMSLWDDHYSQMLWLDSTFPTDADHEEAGDRVTYSNIKFGPIGSTFKQ